MIDRRALSAFTMRRKTPIISGGTAASAGGGEVIDPVVGDQSGERCSKAAARDASSPPRLAP
jgi:hypothetical protein